MTVSEVIDEVVQKLTVSEKNPEYIRGIKDGIRTLIMDGYAVFYDNA